MGVEVAYLKGIKCYRFSDDLVIDPSHGVLGTTDDYSVDDSETRVIRVNFTMPASFFEPTLVNVEFPAELVPPQKAEVVKVEIPVGINETNTDRVVVTSASPGSNGFIAYLTRELRKFMGKDQVDGSEASGSST